MIVRSDLSRSDLPRSDLRRSDLTSDGGPSRRHVDAVFHAELRPPRGARNLLGSKGLTSQKAMKFGTPFDKIRLTSIVFNGDRMKKLATIVGLSLALVVLLAGNSFAQKKGGC